MDNRDQLETLLDDLMSQLLTTEEASEKWELSQDHIKRLCSSGKIAARKRGKTWFILKDQPSPKQL
ncbi:helix-turn-helix domain-containing protein [Paenibacillus taichungensis]